MEVFWEDDLIILGGRFNQRPDQVRPFLNGHLPVDGFTAFLFLNFLILHAPLLPSRHGQY